MCKNCVQEFKIKTISSASFHPSHKDFIYLDGVIYGADYHENPALQAAIRQFKYRFTKELGDTFADLTSGKLKELKMCFGKKIFLIPVPLHKKRLAYRGFNQAELIAIGTASRFAKKIDILHLLHRVKNTSQQAKLSKNERHQNLSHAFEVAGDLSVLSNGVCFLVDDVCTTGSTLDHCAKILKENGVKKVYGLVVARAFR